MLFIMRGASCSGKDTLISKVFPNKNHVLSSDNFREMLVGDISSQQHNARVFEMIHEILDNRLANRVNWTVLNATHLRIRDIAVPIELCKRYKVPFTIISIEPPSINELMARNEKRHLQTGQLIPESVLDRHVNRYYDAMDPFLREARYNPLCTFVEIDQNEKVIRDA